MDDRITALAKKAFVPGDPSASELVKRIFSVDSDEQMPPPDSHRHLTQAQKEMLRRWIGEGAIYETHWAFRAPIHPSVPTVTARTWPRNAVDRFIIAKLETLGIQPSPEADRARLIRRVYLDLTGLPPSPSEVDLFKSDPRADGFTLVGCGEVRR